MSRNANDTRFCMYRIYSFYLKQFPSYALKSPGKQQRVVVVGIGLQQGMSEDEGGDSRSRTYSEWEVIPSITPPPEDLKHLLPPTPNAVSQFRLPLCVHDVDNRV